MKISVSCIIPVYNESFDQVLAALKSVLKSIYKVSEIIVVDDGSFSDDAEKAVFLVNKLTQVDIVYFRQDNLGPSCARNAGAKLAKSEWIAFLDADDLLLESGLSAKIDFLVSNFSDTLAGVYGRFLWSDTGCEQRFYYGLALRRDWVGVPGKAPGGVPSYLIRKVFFDEVGGFDPALRFNEDFDLILRLISKGYHFYGVKEPGFIRVVNPNSLTRSQEFKTLSANRAFLINALRGGLLSKAEICRRYILNYLSTAKLACLIFLRKKR